MTRSSSHLLDLLAIPELIALDSRTLLVRIPPELDVPLTKRVRNIIDTQAFRRLTRISQLGLVSLVYPGARHSRFEHSLGVYRLALLVLKRLAHDPRFQVLVTPEDAKLLIVSALLHDIGHYPYCHLVEDLKLPGTVPHEAAAASFLLEGELFQRLIEDWEIDPQDILVLLNHLPITRKPNEEISHFERRQKVYRLLMSILSGPVDIDKMDYLSRDSLGAGVPYGRHFDQERLIGSLCLNEAGDGLAITDKGKTAAELMVFARYVMFSEVYWHHTVRSATVMFQRAFDMLAQSMTLSCLIQKITEDPEYFWRPLQTDDHRPAVALLNGIFGPHRQLYKRVQQFSIMEEPEIYAQIAGSPYPELRAISQRFVEIINQRRQTDYPLNDILIDSPPVDKEVEFKIDVYYPSTNQYRPLTSVSPVVRALACEQFDDYVKRVRIFANPEIVSDIRSIKDINHYIREAMSSRQPFSTKTG